MSKTNVLLVGPIGTGKTASLRTIAPTGKQLFCIPCEPGIERILTHGPLCHWHYIEPANPDWDTMKDNADKVNRFDHESLIKMKAGMNKAEYRQFIELLDTLANFKCDVCGETFGAVDSWDDSRVLAIDGLSGISIMSMDLVVGGKPVKSQSDWGIAMDNVERLVNKLCAATKCSFILTSHMDREVDEITGGTKLMVSTLGRKLAPKVPRFFDEVVLTVRDEAKFFWSTTEMGVDLKCRRLPWSDKITPDLGPLLMDDDDAS